MYTTRAIPSLISTSVKHHVEAADHHERAAELHRQAATHYIDGEYQRANEDARQAKDQGMRAIDHCALAMK
jgi:hypothetical protein